jgi:cytosine/adenosine deaminase-related metal-dependent hydrolase
MQASREPDAWRERAIVRGLAESQQAGIAMVGEIVTPPCPEKIYSTSSPQSTLFLELLGLAPERMEPLWNLAVEHIASGKKALNVGLSPHAPYTVHPELLARVCRLSQQHQFPIAMHLAETIEELELLQSASGALATFLNNLGAWSSNMLPRGLKPLDYLEQLAQAHAALVVHGNYLSAQEIEFLGTRSAHMSVVYCPRTHAYFHAGDYPLADMLAANVNVCLGTDSRASNPNLALWEEMQWIAQRHPRVSLEGVLHLGTLSGAEALHCDDRFGSITPGKQAVFCAVELLVNDGRDPHEILFSQQTKVHRLYYDA